MKPLRTLNRLKDPRDLWLFLQILSMLVILPRRIGRLSLPVLLKEIDPGISSLPRDKAKLEKTVGLVDSLLKYRVFQRYGKCLLRSLILFRFLRLQGWPVSIYFGVRKTEAGAAGVERRVPVSLTRNFNITGHSWLVLNGNPFLEDNEGPGAFTETYSFPRKATP